MTTFSIHKDSATLTAFKNKLDKLTPKSRYENNIKAIRLLKENPYQLTDEQRLTLAAFAGWGALADVFDVCGHESGWKLKAQEELRSLLTEEEYRLASESIINAHYTEPSVCHAIWEALTVLGFNGGDVLEPSCGNGMFIASMPEELRKKSSIVGVELDKYPANIAQLLHQDATIYNCGFEKAPLDECSFDLVISNVPFGNYGVNDAKYNALKLSIHNYFLAKASDLVRPGGYIAVITSTSFLDSKDNHFREWLGNKLHLCYCVRLPNNAFKDIANTEVTTDILFFRRYDDKDILTDNSLIWRNSKEIYLNLKDWDVNQQRGSNGCTTEINNVYVNEFKSRRYDLESLSMAEKNEKAGYQESAEFWRKKLYKRSNLELLLGTPCVNKLYGRGFGLTDDGRDIEEGIIYPAKILVKNFDYSEVTITKSQEQVRLPISLIDTKDGEYVIWENNVYRRIGNSLENTSVNINKFQSFVNLKLSVDDLIKVQQTGTDDELTISQQKCLQVLTDFESKYGVINSKENIKELGNDNRYYLLRSLRDDKGKVAAIFNQRLCRVHSIPDKVTDAVDALMYSMNEKGCLDIEYIQSLMLCDKDTVIERLKAESLIYFDPELNTWVKRDEYLSGNVFRKLQLAREHQLEDNVNALMLVQPLPMLPQTNNEEIKINCLKALDIDFDNLTDEEKTRLLSKPISVKLGTNWIPGKVYYQFAEEVLKITAYCQYAESPISTWSVISHYPYDYTEYGTSKLSSWELLEKALNQQDPKVIVKTAGEFDAVLSGEHTEAARGKLQAIKEAFLSWIWEDSDRAIELCKYYNENINVYAERKFDGSYLRLPGSNPNIQLRPWQRDSVARIIETRSVFLAHEVGLGKTLTMVAGVMECIRLGFTKRPMLVALNGTEKQIYDAFKLMYPMSNVYCPGKLDADGLKQFTARIATGGFDCVIVTLSQFFILTMSPDYLVAFLNEEKSRVEELLSKNKESRGLTKSIQKTLKRIEHRIDKVTNSKRKYNHIYFEQLGIDMLLIDEIHKCKNLGVLTKIQNVRGIQTNQSERALDTYMKILYVAGDLVSGTNQGRIIGSTGTMISNTMVEIFTWQRMFQHKWLTENKLDNFDSWISQFGNAIASSEISAAGEYKVITRFKSFQNLQVLRNVMAQFVDIATVAMVGNDILKRPNATYINVSVEPSENQLEFLRNALKRAEAIRNRKVDPTVDNMLKVTSDLTKAALSMRLLGYDVESHNSKLHECAFNVWQIWKATHEIKGVQSVFCDFSVPKKDEYSVYAYVKLVLISLGIPEHEIQFVHDYDGAKRSKFFDKVNCGDVRIVFGSTEKLGTGCNIHLNGLYAEHHIDAPWRPSDIEQRDGRAIRQGNGEGQGKLLSDVLIFRYVTERLDALRWQTLQWKQEMIAKFLNGVDLDSLEDCDQVVYSFDQVKALATGNPILIEESNLRNELNSLLIQQREHNRQQLSLGYKIQTSRNKIEHLKKQIKAAQRDVNIVCDDDADKSQLQLQAITKLKEMKASGRQSTVTLFEYKGFTLESSFVLAKNAFTMTAIATTSYQFPFKSDKTVIKVDVKNITDCIDKLIELLPTELERLQSVMITTQTELERFVNLKGRVYPKQQRINEIKQRLDEIDKQLAETHEGLGVSSSDDSDCTDEEWFDNESVSIDRWQQVDTSVINELLERPTPQYLQTIYQQV